MIRTFTELNHAVFGRRGYRQASPLPLSLPPDEIEPNATGTNLVITKLTSALIEPRYNHGLSDCRSETNSIDAQAVSVHFLVFLSTMRCNPEPSGAANLVGRDVDGLCGWQIRRVSPFNS